MRPSRRRVIFPSRYGGLKSKKTKLRAMAHVEEESFFSIPHYFRQPPPILDKLATETSSAQQDSAADCLPFLKGTFEPIRSPFDLNKHGVPCLDRQQHIDFLRQSLEGFSAAFVALDASRPWMVYWALMGLYLLGEDVTQYRERLERLQSPPI